MGIDYEHYEEDKNVSAEIVKLKFRTDLKDWEVAREMFGSNTKEICKIVKDLRKKGTIEPHCEGWSIVVDNNITYTYVKTKDGVEISRESYPDPGWLIPNELLE